MSQRVGIVCGAPVMSAIVTGVVAATILPGLQFAFSVNAAIARSGAAIVLAIFLRLPTAAAPVEAREPVEVTA